MLAEDYYLLWVGFPHFYNEYIEIVYFFIKKGGLLYLGWVRGGGFHSSLTEISVGQNVRWPKHLRLSILKLAEKSAGLNVQIPIVFTFLLVMGM